MENYKTLKPHYSQACDRLYDRVKYLMAGLEDKPKFADNDLGEARFQQHEVIAETPDQSLENPL